LQHQAKTLRDYLQAAVVGVAPCHEQERVSDQHLGKSASFSLSTNNNTTNSPRTMMPDVRGHGALAAPALVQLCSQRKLRRIVEFVPKCHTAPPAPSAGPSSSNNSSICN
jgi:hypothetical protein